MAARPRPVRASDDVATFFARCTHPLRAELDALRAIVARAAPELVEGVKWNAPSYRLADGDDCLTFNLSAKDRVRLIFHRGAKAKDARGGGRLLADDGGLLEWPAPDRAVATFRSMAEVKAARVALAQVVRAWLAAVAC
jgi:uncharacterized protein YdeI (YjbR/CyaY-like superfamily)